MYFIIPELYGSIEEQKGYKYLIAAPIEINDEVLTDYKKICNEILKNINKINNSAYVFKEDYDKIRVGSVKCEDEKDEINLPLNKLIKFNALAISNRLIIEKVNELFLEAYLEECLYNDKWFKE